MAKFRKKPQEVEAVQIIEGSDYRAEVVRLIGGTLPYDFSYDGGVLIESDSGGVMSAVEGDWVVKDSRGEIYTCKSNAFSASYEECDAKACVAEREDSLERLYDPFNSDSPVVLLEGKSGQWYVLKSAIAYVTPLDDPNTHSLVYMDGSAVPIYVKQCCSYFTFFGIPFKK